MILVFIIKINKAGAAEKNERYNRPGHEGQDFDSR